MFTIIFINDKIKLLNNENVTYNLISGGQCTRLKGKRRKPVKKVNALRQKPQLVYNKELSNATRKGYISLFMRFVSQSAL